MASRRIALLCSEPLRDTLAGIGIRYLAMARELCRQGFEVRLLSPSSPAEVPETPAVALEFDRARLAVDLAGCDVAVAQGTLANVIIDELPDLPLVIDLYDPWLVENLHYGDTLGTLPYQRDHAAFWLQLARGDLFLCASEEQRLFYLGFLAAVGRINPERFASDPSLGDLIATVPFGVPMALPLHRQVLPDRVAGERRLLFGALYDWYDPWPLLEVLESLYRPSWQLLFARTPNPRSTPQQRLAEVESWARGRGILGSRVQILDWLPADRRFDLFREVDVLVCTDRPGLEASLSLRTRFLEAVAASCPVVTFSRGATDRILTELNAGVVVPAGDFRALGSALIATLDGDSVKQRSVAAAREVVRRFAWQTVLQPLVAFCEAPKVDWAKYGYADTNGHLRMRRVWGSNSALSLGTPADTSAIPVVPIAARLPGRGSISIALAVQSEHALAAVLAAAGVGLGEVVAGATLSAACLTMGGGVRRAVRRVDWPGVQPVECSEGLSRVAAWNLLVRHCDADWIALVDERGVWPSRWLDALAPELRVIPGDVGAISLVALDSSGTRLHFAGGDMAFDGSPRIQGRGLPLTQGRPPCTGQPILFPCMEAMLLRSRVVAQVGGFDASLSGDHAALDFGWRLWSAGWRIVLLDPPRVCVDSSRVAQRNGSGHDEESADRQSFRVAYKSYDAGFFERAIPAILLARAQAPAAGKAMQDELASLHRERAIVQGRRLRSDREIFAQFPLQLPDRSEDELQLLSSPALSEWLPAGIQLPARTLR